MRAFLYDVVNNARSGLDVDKLDYFKRCVAGNDDDDDSSCMCMCVVDWLARASLFRASSCHARNRSVPPHSHPNSTTKPPNSDARNCAVDITPGWERMMEEARVALAEGLQGHDHETQSYQVGRSSV